ncbi:MAG: metallophosphoesterase [Acidobacteriaceae bacterium]|nr:metallophosphoesterase [Acidobacteriaceae bacterium]MBV9037489.1 metallophosphoesterase [Acidobacteriaceae bacterium]MBV9225497.1 metallophosphoesterase [Acidobacteriaceae bacterium]MBV9307177.1 metallophosphoesterase [Acidobacteriaceae bacterium]MBV9675702.1 metallophosphoesterase [Acidobacteriaceae bacterium]
MGKLLLPVLPGLQAHASGALWLPESQTAIIADLHLGYSWAQRRRGELGPLADLQTRGKLFQCNEELRPKRFVFLGDIVHAPRSCAPEHEWIAETLQQLSQNAQLIAVRGNHDRQFAAEFAQLNLLHLQSWSEQLLTAIHGDRFEFTWPKDHTLVLGHLHPALGIRDASGAGQKLPVFLANRQCVVLPAFSPFARGYNVACGLPAEIRRCFGEEGIHIYAASGKRVVRLGLL